MGVGMILMDC